MSGTRRFLLLATAALVTLALVRMFVVQSFVVPTGSMDPTVRPGDRVLVSRIGALTGEVRRGDVVVFDAGGVFTPAAPRTPGVLAGAGRAGAALLSLPVGTQDYVKRVIGLPGERIRCCTPSGQITVDGVPLQERYVNPADVPSDSAFDVTVPAGRLWVMGDHRSASADSRAHRDGPGGGTVPVDRVVGRVVGVYWPPSRVGTLGRTGP